MVPNIERSRFMEELLSLSFKKYGGFFVQEEVEECVPDLVNCVGGRWAVCNHREEKHIPRYEPSVLPQCLHARTHEGLTQDGWLDIAAGEI